jgi:O-antigen/teichoic acid export membrane protein
MKKFAMKYFNAVLTGVDGTGDEMLATLYHRAISSDFIQKVAETFATRLLLIGIGLVTSVIVARILGPEGRGLYAVALTVVAIGVQFGNFGLHASNTYHVARNRELLPALVGNTFLVSFGLGSIGSALVWVIFLLWPRLAPVQGLLLVLALAWIPFGLAYMLIQNLLLGINEIRHYNIIESASRIIGLALIGLVIVYGLVTVEMVLLAGFLASVISFIWSLWGLRPHLNRLPLLSFTLLKENLGYALKAYVAAFFAFLVLRVDLLMVRYILGTEQAGYYSVAVTLGDMVYMLPVTVGTILFPRLSGMSGIREKWNVTKKAILLVGLVMVFLASCAASLADPVVRLLFGEAFMPAVPAFMWLLPGIVILSINTCYMNYFASVGMPSITVISPGMAAIVNIAMNLKLIPWLGIVGASLASVLSYGLMFVASILYVSYFGEKSSI